VYTRSNFNLLDSKEKQDMYRKHVIHKQKVKIMQANDFAAAFSNTNFSSQKKEYSTEERPKLPFMYMPRAAKLQFRLVPEIITNSQGQSQLSIGQTIWAHDFNFQKGKGSIEERIPLVKCVGKFNNCPMCKMAEEIEKAEVPNAWKVKAQPRNMVRVHVYQGQVPEKDQQYLMLNQTVFMSMNNTAYKTLTAQLDAMEPDQAQMLINPLVPANPMWVQTGATGRDPVTFGVTMGENAIVPPIPDIETAMTFNQLAAEFAIDMTDEHLHQAREKYQRVMASSGGRMYDPSVQGESSAFNAQDGGFGQTFGGAPAPQNPSGFGQGQPQQSFSEPAPQPVAPAPQQAAPAPWDAAPQQAAPAPQQAAPAPWDAAPQQAAPQGGIAGGEADQFGAGMADFLAKSIK